MIDTSAFSTSERRRYQSCSPAMANVVSLGRRPQLSPCVSRVVEPDMSCQSRLLE